MPGETPQQFPDDIRLLNDIVALAVNQLGNLRLARPWLLERIKIASYWRDHALLSRIEAENENIAKAKEHLALVKKLQRQQRFLMDSPREAREVLDQTRDFIRFQEQNRWVTRLSSRRNSEPAAQEAMALHFSHARRDARALDRKKESRAEKAASQQIGTPPVATPSTTPLPSSTVPIRFALSDFSALSDMLQNPGTLRECQLRVDHAYLGIQSGFDELLCLNAIHGVEQ